MERSHPSDRSGTQRSASPPTPSQPGRRADSRAEFAVGGSRLGLIAGAGHLPVEVVRRLRGEGCELAAIAFEGLTDAALDAALPEGKLRRLRLGRLAAMAEAMDELGIDRVLLLGKVSKTLLFDGSELVEPDEEAIALLARLADRADEPLMGAIAEWLVERGFELASQEAELASMLATRGPLSKRVPQLSELADLAVGRAAVAGLGRAGVGQCVVVKQGCVLALEAIEGTDAAIRRAGELGGAGATVVKAARPGQDRRFDLPAVGPDTIEAMRRAGASALAIEAGSSLIIDAAAVGAAADRAEIAVWGFDASEDAS
ncbi:MAG: hypothetical protein CL908_15070 [Deltaproteobacteria bacterium]|nr:hypothetical protein [Deltaproteobacteria bacterium]